VERLLVRVNEVGALEKKSKTDRQGPLERKTSKYDVQSGWGTGYSGLDRPPRTGRKGIRGKGKLQPTCAQAHEN